MRRVRAGVIAGVLLALVLGASGAHALWQRTAALPAGVSTTGDLNVTAAWVGGTPVWAPLFPGDRAEGTLRVTGTGAGGTLRWRLQVAGAVAPAFSSYTTFQAWQGACGTGTPIPAAGYPSGTPLAVGASVDVCVRFTLATSAPGSLQGQSMSPTITVTAQQVSG
jgi:hypothetical protein